MLQSKAGVANQDYLAQKALLARLDKGELQLAEVQSKTKELFEAEVAKLNSPQPSAFLAAPELSEGGSLWPLTTELAKLN